MSIETHINNFSNPHQLTKEQIGLGALHNYPIASEAEIRALAANDRYIREADSEFVNSAFRDYLYQIGLVDGDGFLILANIDLNGGVTFTIDPETGAVTLYGTHPTAFSVDVFLRESTAGKALLFEQLDVPVTSQQWTANTTSLVLDAAVRYELTLVYRNQAGEFIGKFVTANEDQYYTVVIYDSDDDTLDFYGIAHGIDLVDVRAYDGDAVLYNRTGLIPDSARGYFWSHSVANASLTLNNDFNALTILKNTQGVEQSRFYSRGFESLVDNAVRYLVGPSAVFVLNGILPYVDHLHVIITRNGLIIFDSDTVQPDPVNGFWTVDVSGLSLSTSDANTVWVRAYDRSGNLAYDKTKNLRSTSLINLDVIDWIDQGDSHTPSVTTQWIDEGIL